MIKNRSKLTQRGFSKRTSQLHINPKLHKKFKGFCLDNNKTMQEVTERLIIDAMKHPELV